MAHLRLREGPATPWDRPAARLSPSGLPVAPSTKPSRGAWRRPGCCPPAPTVCHSWLWIRRKESVTPEPWENLWPCSLSLKVEIAFSADYRSNVSVILILQNRTHHLEIRCVYQGVLMGSVLAPTPLHSSFLVLFLSEQETGPAGEAELRPLPLWSTTKAGLSACFPEKPE